MSMTKWLSGTVVLGASLFANIAYCEETKIDVKDLPKAVVDAIHAKYPKAEIEGAEKETEDGKTIYEVEIEYEVGDKEHELEISLTPEGKILEIEKEIDVKDLPKAVAEAIAKKFPKATLKEAEEVSKVADGKDVVDSYEVTLVTADKKTIEVTVTAAGKITEEEEKKDDDKKEDKKDEKKKEEKKAEKK